MTIRTWSGKRWPSVGRVSLSQVCFLRPRDGESVINTLGKQPKFLSKTYNIPELKVSEEIFNKEICFYVFICSQPNLEGTVCQSSARMSVDQPLWILSDKCSLSSVLWSFQEQAGTSSNPLSYGFGLCLVDPKETIAEIDGDRGSGLGA